MQLAIHSTDALQDFERFIDAHPAHPVFIATDNPATRAHFLARFPTYVPRGCEPLSFRRVARC